MTEGEAPMHGCLAGKWAKLLPCMCILVRDLSIARPDDLVLCVVQVKVKTLLWGGLSKHFRVCV